MFQLPTFKFWSRSRLSASSSKDDRAFGVDLPASTVYEIETSPEKRTRTLKHLVRANHVNYSLIYHSLEYHNHNPHILGSSYILGASPDHLQAIYDHEVKELEPWTDSPGEISKHDWRDFLGDRKYQRAFIDFFEDELVTFDYDWKKLTEHYLLDGEQPLINGIIAGLGHPLIHLSYAYILSNRTIAIEALTLATTSYNHLHNYLDDPSYTFPVDQSTTSLLSLLNEIHTDPRFSDFPTSLHGTVDSPDPFKTHERPILEYWNRWTITSDVTHAFHHSQELVTLLFCTTDPPSNPPTSTHDFFLVHLLTTSHAIRIILPLLPNRHHISLLRQWWLLTITTYLTQHRPKIHPDRLTNYNPTPHDWNWVIGQAVNGPHSLDSHYVKAIHTMKEASETWNHTEHDAESWLKAAVMFAAGFKGWGGFGPSS